ncbi:hypothetical protein GCM10007205_00960 [Oxalicibacterium flavum]|uniref:YbjN domain-containing protein n=1 Tax=Oxalicibacterium flavum TaxID=179467 RepID=A0A8J2UMS1_9BURK|nr:YbjN domain-containing protein [Oxalicibacterium flavum]GGB95543.1 hypothetical protein GCM10007205_00960 [Oxalicibacterium flavum]
MSKNENSADKADELLQAVTPQQVADAIRNAGCAVHTTEKDGVTWLHSASHGIGFQVLWGNLVGEGRFADLTLSCPLRVQGGSLPDGILNDWHRTKRFARVVKHGDFIVLEMDVVAVGGVSVAHLQLSMQLWTQMMGQFFLYLRNYKAEDQNAKDAVPSEAETKTAEAAN